MMWIPIEYMGMRGGWRGVLDALVVCVPGYLILMGILGLVCWLT
jgi:hypothetical protein